MQLLLMSLPVIIALVWVGVLRPQREHRRMERAKALRAARWEAQRRLIPHVSANLCGSAGAGQTAPIAGLPPRS